MMIKCVSVSEHIVCVWFVCEHMYTFGHVSICAHSIYACVCGNVLSDVFMWLSVGGGACVFDLRCGVYVCLCVNTECVWLCVHVYTCVCCVRMLERVYLESMYVQCTNRYGYA